MMQFISPTLEARIRNDAWGLGYFGAKRTNHLHRGVDLNVKPGDAIRNPHDGVFIRVIRAYKDTRLYKGASIDCGYFRVRILYIDPDVKLLGLHLDAGELLGKAQDISKRYDLRMHPHIHFEIHLHQSVLGPMSKRIWTPADPELFLDFQG